MPVMISWNRAGQVGITDRPDRQAGVPRESRETCGNRWTMTMSPPHRNRADYFPGHQRVLVFRSAIIYLALSLVQQPGPSCPATLRKRLYCTSYSLSATRPPQERQWNSAVIIIFWTIRRPRTSVLKDILLLLCIAKRRRDFVDLASWLLRGVFPYHYWRPENYRVSSGSVSRNRKEKDRKREGKKKRKKAIFDRQAPRLAGLVDGRFHCKILFWQHQIPLVESKKLLVTMPLVLEVRP